MAWTLARGARKERKLLARRENLLAPDEQTGFSSSPDKDGHICALFPPILLPFPELASVKYLETILDKTLISKNEKNCDLSRETFLMVSVRTAEHTASKQIRNGYTSRSQRIGLTAERMQFFFRTVKLNS